MTTGGSFDVRVWKVGVIKRGSGTTYRVRWTVERQVHSESFATRKLAESFHASLLSASRRGEAFDPSSGRPNSEARRGNGPTWFEFAQAFMDVKWSEASPRHRKSTAEGLVTITMAMLDSPVRTGDRATRGALMRWAFNTPARQGGAPPEPEDAVALAWVARHSRPLADLAESDVLRSVLDAIGRTLAGERAAPATTNRKRAALTSAIGYAVELGHLTTNPMPRVRVRRQKTTEALDSRLVVNHAQARALLAEVRESSPALEAFYACIYYAAMRPSEVRNLRRENLELPPCGWGTATLTASYQDAGSEWTDDGAMGEERALKHRAPTATRPVPLAPQLVAALREHLDRFGTGPDGRLFVSRDGKGWQPVSGGFGGPVSLSTVAKTWQRCRARAFERPGQTLFPGTAERSPLARRPYDLRHACVSTWLAAGVPAPQVAGWAGHSVAVLLKVYAKAVEGQGDVAQQRIDAALALTL